MTSEPARVIGIKDREVDPVERCSLTSVVTPDHAVLTIGARQQPVRYQRAQPGNRANDYVNNNIPAGYTLTAGTITFTARGQRENATSDFIFSGGPAPLSFRVHQETGLVEVL